MAVFVPFRLFQSAIRVTLGAGRKAHPAKTLAACWSPGEDGRPVRAWVSTRPEQGDFEPNRQ